MTNLPARRNATPAKDTRTNSLYTCPEISDNRRMNTKYQKQAFCKDINTEFVEQEKIRTEQYNKTMNGKVCDCKEHGFNDAMLYQQCYINFEEARRLTKPATQAAHKNGNDEDPVGSVGWVQMKSVLQSTLHCTPPNKHTKVCVRFPKLCCTLVSSRKWSVEPRHLKAMVFPARLKSYQDTIVGERYEVPSYSSDRSTPWRDLLLQDSNPPASGLLQKEKG